MKVERWILCPVCGNKTRNRIREDTVLKNYPLYCPECKQETIIDVKKWLWLSKKIMKNKVVAS